jgi:RimJ/RimL family protein N-acetyltransferase
MTDQIALRPATESDIQILEHISTDPEAGGYFNWAGYADAGIWRRRWSENRLFDQQSGPLMVVRDDDVLGFVSWNKLSTSHASHCWEIGIALLPEARGQGYGVVAQRKLVEYLFAHTQVKRIQACTDVDNVAEQRALEKCGFTREGVLRGYYFRDGYWRDAVVSSILRDEFNQQAG